MILETTNHFNVDESDELFKDQILGEESELAEFALAAQADIHNVTMALARLEHHCIVENADVTILEAGISEWFASIKKTIIEYWQRFRAWLTRMYHAISDAVFGPRERWLNENTKDLSAMTEFGGAKVTLGKIAKANPSIFFSKVGKVDTQIAALASKAIDEGTVGKAAGGEDARETVQATFQAELVSGYDSKKGSMAKYMHDTMVGPDEEFTIDKGLVDTMTKTALESFRTMEKLPAMAKEADAMIALINSKSNLANTAGDAAAKAKIARTSMVLNVAGSVFSTYTSAAVATLKTINGQMMRGLAKALSAGKSKAKATEPAAKNESVLAAYM